MKTIKLFVTKSVMLISLASLSMLYIVACGHRNNGKDDNKISVDSVPADMVYNEVDQMPVYHGGDTALLSFIAKNTVYPEEAKKKNIQGRVVVGFIVEKDGAVSEANILSGVDPMLDAEAVRVVSSLPKFEKAGIKNGVTVRVKYMVPITYALR